jgi:hypothetical protein
MYKVAECTVALLIFPLEPRFANLEILAQICPQKLMYEQKIKFFLYFQAFTINAYTKKVIIVAKSVSLICNAMDIQRNIQSTIK